jgi:hypothetical protein
MRINGRCSEVKYTVYLNSYQAFSTRACFVRLVGCFNYAKGLGHQVYLVTLFNTLISR